LGDGLRLRIEQMQGRLARLEERATKRRSLARDVMVECDIKKIAAPHFTVLLRAGSPSVQITDEREIPDKYWEAREPRLNRQSLSADLKTGAAIAGALLTNPQPVLSVRVK
jgi:hypothetical protein